LITVREYAELHSTLTAIAEKELRYPIPVPEAVKAVLAPGDGNSPVPEPALAWLALLDLAVNPALLRLHLKQQGDDETCLRSFLRFMVGRKPHRQSDRDKVDWLATYLFQAREERTKEPTGWPKAEIAAILQGFDFPPLSQDAESLLGDVSSLLEEIRYFDRFSQITDSRIVPRGRELKNRFGDELFHPDVLAAVINYNLVFGKKFHALLHQTMQKVHEFASRLGSGAPDTSNLLQTDYRSTSDTLRHLSELGRKQESEKPPGPRAPAITAEPAPRPGARKVAGDATGSVEQLKELGIDVDMEAFALKKRAEELAVRLRANPGVSALPGAFAALPLLEWEAAAFRSGYPLSEQSFRADFARGVCHAIAILSLADDELLKYQEKKGTEYLWKKHYDALLYLLQEGRAHKERLIAMAVATEKKGLLEKAKQLLQTAGKLEAGFGRIAAIF